MKSIRTFPPAALTIAGSDCSGGAGIEADLKTFAAHRVYGMAAITCLVAETPGRVVAIQAVSPRLVRQQIACCLEGMPPVAVKTGMLYSREIIRAVAESLQPSAFSLQSLIVDPVMVATSGRRLLREDAVRAMKDLILRRAELVTPNLDEARILAEGPITTPAQMERAAAVIARRFECAVLMKGGHLRDARWALDFFWDGQDGFWMRSPRLRGAKTHGTGCTTSAAIAAGMASGWTMPRAVRAAKRYVHSAIRRSLDLGPWSALAHHAD
jgi:hydroxymethylpyrimidine kinase/phosphomethylpyrimidine kinase